MFGSKKKKKNYLLPWMSHSFFNNHHITPSADFILKKPKNLAANLGPPVADLHITPSADSILEKPKLPHLTQDHPWLTLFHKHTWYP